MPHPMSTPDVILARHLRVGDVIPALDVMVESVVIGRTQSVVIGRTRFEGPNTVAHVWPDHRAPSGGFLSDDAMHVITFDLDEPVTIARRTR